MTVMVDGGVDRFCFLTIALAALVSCGDETIDTDPSTARTTSALTVTGTNVLGFEDPASWTVTPGIPSARSTTHSEGTYSLALNARSWVTIKSQAINVIEPVGPVVTYDLMLPTQQPNVHWYGATQAYLECPTANVFNAYLGQTELTGFPLAQWRRISSVVPPDVLAQLAAGCPALTVTIVLNVPVNAIGTYNLDNVVLGSSPPLIPAIDRKTEIATIDETMGLERVDRWSVVGAALATDSRHTDGQRSLALSNLGYAELRSVPLASLPGITSTIGFEIMLPNQQVNPTWFGHAELYVDIPSLGIVNRLVGHQELTGKPKNQWLMVRFALDADLQTSLRQRYTDLRFKLVLNVPQGSPGPYLFDNLRTHAVTPFLECILNQSGRVRALFGYDNPSSDFVEIADRFANRLNGVASEPLSTQPVNFFQSGRQHGALWADVVDSQLTWTVGRGAAIAFRTGSPQCTLTPGSNGGAVTVGSVSVPVPGFGGGGIVASETIGTTSTTPGALLGSFAVDDSGGATYRIPIKVSPGRAGIEPDLALVYGGDANGPLGVGWSLSGFSEISRCARTIAHDGYSEEVSFLDFVTIPDSPYCLDGERLIPIVPALDNTIDNREYRTERNSFAKIVAHKAGAGNGPDTFEVFLRDGRILMYGGGTATLGGSQVRYTANPADKLPAVADFGAQVRLAWSLAEVRDRHGNAMRIAYVNTEDPVDHSHQHLPERIDYTLFLGGPPALRSVRFFYGPRSDIEVSYVSGFPLRVAQRMARVEVWGPNPTQTGLLRQYSFGYNRRHSIGGDTDLNSVTRRSLLTSVTECDAVGVCLSPTLFNWNSSSAATYQDIPLPDLQPPAFARPADVDGDGKDDVIYAGGVNTAAGYYFRRSTGEGLEPPVLIAPIISAAGAANVVPGTEAIPLDFDADGRADFAGYLTNVADHNQTQAWNLFHSFGDHYVPTPYLLTFDLPPGRTVPRHYYGDLTGDGRTDRLAIFLANGTQPTWGMDSTFVLTGPPPKATILGPGVTISPAFFQVAGVGQNNYVARIHGDARMSMLMQDLSVPSVPELPKRYAELTITKDGTVLTGEPEKVRMTTLPTAEFGAYRFPDLNGDGLADAVSFTASGASQSIVAKYMANTGNGFSEERPVALPSLPNAPFIKVADVDGDGQQDVVSISGSGIAVFQGRSQGGLSTQPMPMFGLPLSPGSLVEPMDANGDGLTDFLMQVPGSDGGGMHLFVRSEAKPDLLQSISDGMRKQTTITYASMSDPAVYTPPQDCSYPVTCVKRGRWLVSRYVEDDGTTALNGLGQPQSLRSFLFTYAGGKADLKGRGWLGFSSRTVTDVRAIRVTTLEYHNDGDGGVVDASPAGFVSYPKAGLRKSEIVDQFFPGVSVIRRMRTWNHGLLSGSEVARGKSYSMVIGGMTERVWDHPDTEPTSDQFLIRSSDTNVGYDTFGNETRRDVSYRDGGFERKLRTFTNLPGPWLIGLPDSVTETSRVPGKTDEVRLTRYVPNPVTGVVEQEIQEPNGGPELFRLTEYIREPQGRGQVTAIRQTDTGAKPRTISVVYDSVDGVFPATVSNAAGHTTTLSYHPGLGVPLLSKDPNEVQVTRQFDTFGRLRFESAPLAFSFGERIPNSFTSSISGASVVTIPSLSQTVLPAVPFPVGSFVSLSYRLPTGEPLGAFEVVAARAGGHQVDVIMDRLGREIRRDDYASTVTGRVRTQYDVFGRISKLSRPHPMSEPESQVPYNVFTYDALDRLTARTLPTSDDFPAAGPVTRISYDGLVTQETDDRGFHHVFTQDLRGRLAQAQDLLPGAETVSTSYDYGPFDRLDEIHRSGTTTTVKMQYDRLNRRKHLFDPDAGHRTFTYNGFGEVVRDLTEGVPGDTTYVPDALGRPSQVISPEGTSTFVWDRSAFGVGKLASVDAPDISGDGRVGTVFAYDALGRERNRSWTVAGQTFSFDTAYDGFNRVGSVSYPRVGTGAGARRLGIQYTYYESRGDLRSAVDVVRTAPGGAPFEYWRALARNADGMIASEAFPDSVTTSRAYERARGLPRQIVTQQITTNAPLLQRLDFHRNASGDIRTREDTVTGVTETYDYDGIRRLKSWRGTFPQDGSVGSFEYQYDHDALGNLTGRRAMHNVFDGDLETTTYAHAASNPPSCSSVTPRTTLGPHAVTSVSGVGDHCYDVRGNQVSAPGRQVGFTSFDLPKTVDGPGGRTVFGYDGFGSRVLKRGPGGTVISLGGLYERRVDVAGNVSHVFYVQGEGRPVAQIVWSEVSGAVTGEDTSYLHDDQLGSIDTVGGGNATVRTRFRHDPFGTLVTPDRPQGIQTEFDPVFRLGFTGQIEDRDLGLVDMRGRVYDPRTSTFLTPDPVVSNPAFGPSFNRYAYVSNNPVNLIDPTGFIEQGGPGGPGGPGKGGPPGDILHSQPGGPSGPTPTAAEMQMARDMGFSPETRKGRLVGVSRSGNTTVVTVDVGDDSGASRGNPAPGTAPGAQWQPGFTAPPAPQGGGIYAGPNAGNQPSNRVFAEVPSIGLSYPGYEPVTDPPFPSQVDLLLPGMAALVFLPYLLPEVAGALVTTAAPAAPAGAALGAATGQLVPQLRMRADILRDLFGKGLEGARAALQQLEGGNVSLIPPDLKLEHLSHYRDVAQRVINQGDSARGFMVQTLRLHVIQIVEPIVRRGGQ